MMLKAAGRDTDLHTNTYITEETETIMSKRLKIAGRYFTRMKEAEGAKEKPLEVTVRTKYQSVITIPEGYEISEMMDMDDSVMGDEKPFYAKEVKVIFE